VKTHETEFHGWHLAPLTVCCRPASLASECHVDDLALLPVAAGPDCVAVCDEPRISLKPASAPNTE
jgi:hypothetical protein